MTDKCTWAEDEDSGWWETGCGRLFVLDEGTPSDNCMKFCCYCGKPLEENPFEHEEANGD